jgi:alpha-beta hydrolase superfamily lysophospholipase
MPPGVGRTSYPTLLSEEQAIARAYATEAEIFPDMAHDMMLESRWQQVADRILEWLQQHHL